MLPSVYTTTTTTTTTTLLALLLLLLPLPTPTAAAAHHHDHLRRLLHHPFFPVSSPSPSPSSPHSSHNTTVTTNSTTHPKFPFSDSTTTPTSTATPTTASDSGNPFFPSYSNPPPPPPPSSIPTFPANISSLALPSSASHSSHSTVSPKLVATLIILSFLAVSLITSLAVLLRRKNHRDAPDSADNVRLYPSNAPTSDGGIPPKLPTSAVSHTSSEFLYLGTMATSREFEPPPAMEGPSEVYLKLCGSGSPELKPLPPLPKQSFHVRFQDETENSELEEEVKGEDEEFFSPTASSSAYMAFHASPRRVSVYEESDNFGSKSGNSSCGRSITSSPVNMEARSPVSGGRSSPSRDSEISVELQELLAEAAAAKPMPHAPPPPPPPPPVRSWVKSGSGSGSGSVAGPPALVPPSGPVVFQRSGALSEGGVEKNDETNGKPKLKALHWDKVRASSDRVMVWDQLKPGSFQLNEEMIETLFKVNGGRRSIAPLLNEETRVLHPKKSQNVAILLKALNVTEEEVCEALLEGNADTLGTELLESLLKMAPTKEEEMKLKEYNDESPLKLGPAEKFLKAVLNVPFAFKRVDAMLYIATFESEVEYLRKSFETLETACQELRNSRMFLKLLEAVLKTGNRMNVGTYRGDAQAFKLDTLLKLVDIKGTDGKTTLLHFVVQEIIKAEGTRLSYPDDNPTAPNMPYQTATDDDIDSRKRGLEVVAGLGGELTHVKKAAAMDSDALSTDVAKLAQGIIKVKEVTQLNEETGRIENNPRFSESMKGFLTKAEQDIARIQSQENSAFSRVKELTEYFHGNLAKEEAHPLRIFMVVRDFLGVLDQVCKEVGKINDRTVISATRLSSVTVNAIPPLFPGFTGTHQKDSSSDDESIVLT